MKKQVGVDEIKTTKGEKFLAAILAIFMAMGVLWIYSNPLDRFDEGKYEYDLYHHPQLSTPNEKAVIAAYKQAQRDKDSLLKRKNSQTATLAQTREAYRTELDAGRPGTVEEQRYRKSQRVLAQTNTQLVNANNLVQQTAPASKSAEIHIEQVRRGYVRKIERNADNQRLLTFFLRFAFVLALMVFAYWNFISLRKKRSRNLPVGMAVIAVAAFAAIVLVANYVLEDISFGDSTPLVISIFGTVLTLGTIIALQRLIAKRTPMRRVRKHQCPFCGYPVRKNEFCEGCGRDVRAKCVSCGSTRRVGTQYCGSCGKT